MSDIPLSPLAAVTATEHPGRTAAACVTGRTANSWIEWKDVDGRALGERKAPAQDSGMEGQP